MKFVLSLCFLLVCSTGFAQDCSSGTCKLKSAAVAVVDTTKDVVVTSVKTVAKAPKYVLSTYNNQKGKSLFGFRRR